MQEYGRVVRIGGSATSTDQPLGEQLKELLREKSAGRPAEVSDAFTRGIEAVRASGLVEGSLTVGDAAPRFTLPDATGRPVTLDELVRDSATVLCFYRGGWCPYCNLELRAYEALLPELADAGATFAAISPQTPDASLTTAEKLALSFPVLSDVGNDVARAFGLVHRVTDEVAAIFERNGYAMADRNAQPADAIELPLPGTYVVDAAATIRFAFASADYTERAEPSDVLATVRAL